MLTDSGTGAGGGVAGAGLLVSSDPPSVGVGRCSARPSMSCAIAFCSDAIRFPPARLLSRPGYFNPQVIADRLGAQLVGESARDLVARRLAAIDEAAVAPPGPFDHQPRQGAGDLAVTSVRGHQRQLDGGALAVKEMAGVGDVHQ